MSDPHNPLPLVSFVVPLYNTGSALPKLIEAFRGLRMEGEFELILVNDASPDGTGERVLPLLAEMPVSVTFVDLARNFGEHAAVLEGFRHSKGKFVINLDDDLQNPISEALRLLDHIQKTGADVVYAFYEEKKHHWFRNMGSWLTNWMATWLLDKPKDLYLCSFRAHSRALIDHVIRYDGPYPYIDGLILAATNRIERLLVAHHDREVGASGYTLRKLVRLWMNMFFNFSIMPLRLASVLGMVLAAAGLLQMVLVVLERCLYGVSVQGWSSLMAAVAIFSGAQLLMLGLIGEYIGRSYMTLSGKPQTVVRGVSVHHPNRP
jgi:undecaprenyl-phosphate 4-deoxy-4-formamido-L-arabinose transferase